MFRRSIDWRSRATALIAIILIDKVHAVLFGGPENSPLAVTVYLATAALANVSAILACSHLLRGQLSYDIQRLGFCAIILNFVGWITYLAQMSPVFINYLIGAVTYGQYFRLFYVGGNDADAGGWHDLFCRNFGRSLGRHTEKAKQ